MIKRYINTYYYYYYEERLWWEYSKQTSVQDLLATTNNKETFLQDFLVRITRKS